MLWRHFLYTYLSSLNFLPGQDLALGLDAAEGLDFATGYTLLQAFQMVIDIFVKIKIRRED